MAKPGRIFFVYAGDSGALNALFHLAHKIVSPATYPCTLCSLTHDVVSAKKEWREFVGTLDRPAEFLHRDRFRGKFPVSPVSGFPTVLLAEGGGLRTLATPEEINRCRATPELIALIRAKLSEPCVDAPESARGFTERL
jgi:hypothetical protein